MPSIRSYSALAIILSAPGLYATTAKTDPSPDEIQKIIRSFASNEAEFAKARENYTYTQTVRMQEFDMTGLPGGKFERVEDIVFSREGGKRQEKVVRAPVSTLRNVLMTKEDEQDLRNVLPFVLTSSEIDNYHVRYLGRQKVDELDTYVFAARPKTMEPGKRYFNGQIWVDDRDLMIVKTYGRSTGVLPKKSDQQFPKFETYREQIDGKYWFPTYTIANSTLHFENNPMRIRLSVKYEDYKRFRADTTITFGDEVPDPTKSTEPAKPAEPAKPNQK
ncbi:MAG TPA: hypothetical protein VEQ63_09115 [Bryobacteraceae bacterium]|nr:hypothetical protein [Bryobacteraceae bacterium]